MHKVNAPSKKIQVVALVAVIAVSSTIFGCRGETPADPVQASAASATIPGPAVTAPAPAGTAATHTRSKQEAMAALMALPELKAWSSQIEKSSGGKARGALIEYDPKPKTINAKSYFQFSFVENTSDAARSWESFLVAETGDEILVEDAATDKTMTLDQWRKASNPIARTSAD
jgi:hypothetical protein